MQSPVSTQPFAQAFEACGPSPVRTMSSTPEITSCGTASTPAGPVTGQTSTHLPHFVQASSISAVRAASADSNDIVDIEPIVAPPARKKKAAQRGGLRISRCNSSQSDRGPEDRNQPEVLAIF